MVLVVSSVPYGNIASTIDRAGLAESSVRKERENAFLDTLNYRLFGYQTKGQQNCIEITNNQTTDDIYI